MTTINWKTAPEGHITVEDISFDKARKTTTVTLGYKAAEILWRSFPVEVGRLPDGVSIDLIVADAVKELHGQLAVISRALDEERHRSGR